MKRAIALLLAMLMVFSLVGCGNNAQDTGKDTNQDAEQGEVQGEDVPAFKIGVVTGTVSQGEEEYRAAEQLIEEYGDMVVFQTYPDNFMKEQETVISNLLAMASDPDIKAIVMCQAVTGTAAAFEKIRETRPDILLIAGVPHEQDIIAEKADFVAQGDELAMGYSIPVQAKKLGAKTFVHYSFPRHMSFPLLSQRRDIMKSECEKIGLEFVDATAPDPMGDSGLPGAQQFILEDVPRKVKEYGKDTNFFSTNCGMQEPLISSVLEEGAIYAQQCCPSPYHGFPGALGIEIPQDKAGDVDYALEQIRAEIAEKGGTGRFSTWPVPLNMLITKAGFEYAKAYCEGEITEKSDMEAFKQICLDITGDYEVSIKSYEGTDQDGNPVEFENFYMLLIDFIEL